MNKWLKRMSKRNQKTSQKYAKYETIKQYCAKGVTQKEKVEYNESELQNQLL